jgi:hypothetical protein
LKNLAPFSLGSILRKLNRIHVSVQSQHPHPFPKPEIFWLSRYTYERRYIKIHPDGRIAGGLARFVSSLVDFSFIRSVVAHRYAVFGFAYDPVCLFLLELFRYLEKYPDMKSFVETLRDRDRGRHYRLYAGIRQEHLPCEATFTNFRERLGENLYNRIFHVLVKIAELLGFLSYRILATDGTLFPSHARYRGCTHFCKDCEQVEFQGIIDNVRRRVLYRLEDPARIAPGKEIRVRVECPSARFPPEVPRPKVELLTLALEQADPLAPSLFNQIFGLREPLQKLGLDLVVKRGILTGMDLTEGKDAFFFRCPKLPSDLEARIGVRRNPQNPNRKEKVFGFNAIIDTSIEVQIGIELPVACTTIAGNALEGRHFITNKEQIAQYHGKSGRIHLADAKYDEHDNYRFSRSQGAVPIIDYNPRSEDLSAAALRLRGYDRNGWPFAPCGLLTRPNGFDSTSQRAAFSCRRQCVSSKDPDIVRYARDCPSWINYNGFVRHMPLSQFPRLITEVLRGTERHQKLKALRSASERTNSSAKEDLCILAKPKLRGLPRAGVLAQLAVTVLLLKRIARFIIRVTLLLRRASPEDQDPYDPPFLPGPFIPPFLRNLIQRE